MQGSTGTRIDGRSRPRVRSRRPDGTWLPCTIEDLERVADLCGRLGLVSAGTGLARTLLEPAASFLGAETASLRCMDGSSPRGTMPRQVAVLGISGSVGEAYVSRYHQFDPARRLTRHAFDSPVFEDPARPGVWLREPLTPALVRRYREDFIEYRQHFLIPNDFVQHVGFSVRNRSGQILLFDFHRGRRAQPFDARDVARARAMASYLHARAVNGWSHVDSRPCAPGPEEQLSAREFEVAEAVSRGLSNKEVAASLEISVRTVENHLRSIFAKLGVTSRTRLAAMLSRRPR